MVDSRTTSGRDVTEQQLVGFAPEEIDTAAPTRSARLKWVVVVQQDLPAGRAVNAAACVAAAIGARVQGLLGPDAVDADRFPKAVNE